MDTLRLDLRYALRTLRARPGFTLASVITLALGIGATAAIYSLAAATLLDPLAVRDPERLAQLKFSVSYPDFLDYRSQRGVFEDAAVISERDRMSISSGGQPSIASGAFVSGNFFGMLGVPPQLGRLLAPDDDRPGGELVAVISDAYWQRAFGADPSAVGKTLRVNQRSARIIGVVDRRFRGTSLRQTPDVWLPVAGFRGVETSTFFSRHDPLLFRGMVWLKLIVRMRPGVTLEQAQAAIRATYESTHPASPSAVKDRAPDFYDIQPLAVAAAGFQNRSGLRAFVLLLLGVVGFALLIACANVANMLLARAAGRTREIGVRMALGARRGRLVRQLLTESFVLAGAGAVAGVLVARLFLSLISGYELPGGIPVEALRLSLDWRALMVIVILAVGTGITFGLAPAIQASAQSAAAALREVGRGHTRRNLRGSLIALQVALCLLLLVGGALFIRGLQRALHVELGFRTTDVAVVSTNLGLERFDKARAREFYRLTTERVAALPGVQSVSWATLSPMQGVMMWSFDIEGRAAKTGEFSSDLNIVSPRYFATLGIPVVRGREFSASDAAGSPQVIIVNETFAKQFLGDRDPMTARIRFGADDPWAEVVGVVGDSRMRNLEEAPAPMLFVPFAQSEALALLDRASLLVRTRGDARQVLAAIRLQIRNVDASAPIARVETLDQHLRRQLLPQRMGIALFGFFGVLALVLSAVGIYAVASFIVLERTRELGVRIALGARRSQVTNLVLRQNGWPIASGVLIGLALCAGTARLARGVIYGVEPLDPPMFAAVAVGLAVVALVACYVPARRAARIDPVVALRSE